MQPLHLKLPVKLREKLSNPIGDLLVGEPNEVIQSFKEKFTSYKYLITVGDVVSRTFLEANLNPNLIITDGQTKRSKLENKLNVKGYKISRTESKAAEISRESWIAIQEAFLDVFEKINVHIEVKGEEDLLVLPVILEAPENSLVIYGQPNEGAVVIRVTQSKKFLIRKIIDEMEII